MTTQDKPVWQLEASALMSMIACCGIRPHSATYVSTPITTGPAWLAWQQAAGPGEIDADAHRQQVIVPNLHRAQRLIQKIRTAEGRRQHPVIDPISLDDVPHFTQPDYHRLWAGVVRRFAARVVFLEGWQYSTGCAVEYRVALERHLDLFDEDLKPLGLDKALRLLRDAEARLGQTASVPIELTAARIATESALSNSGLSSAAEA